MIFTKWNWDDAKEIWQEEARETGWEKGWGEGWEEGKVKGWKEGREKGWEQGIQEEKRKNAKAMKAEGMDINIIARITGLTVDEILTL